MATTGFWPVKGSLKNVVGYAENPDKTRRYMSPGYTAARIMRMKTCLQFRNDSVLEEAMWHTTVFKASLRMK